MDSGNKRKDAQIYILSHEKKNWIRNDSLFTPVEVGSYYNHDRQYDIRDNDNIDNISYLNPLFLENTGVYYVYKHLIDRQDKYVGINQHRRIFNIPEDMDFDEEFEHCDLIAHAYGMPMSVRSQYGLYHNIDDLDFMCSLVKEMYPKYGAYINDLYGYKLFLGNCCFVMRKEDFIEYFGMFFDLAYEFMKRKNLMNIEDVYKYCEKTCEIKKAIFKNSTEPSCNVKYQSRIIGYLQERMFTLYAMVKYNGKHMKTIGYMDIDDEAAKYKVTNVF